MADEDDLYWEAKKPAPEPTSLKRKWVQVEEESLDDTVSTIKSGLSTKKTHRTASKTLGTSTDKQEKKNTKRLTDGVASQAPSISQLTEQVNKIKQTNKTVITCFDQLAKQMAALLGATQP